MHKILTVIVLSLFIHQAAHSQEEDSTEPVGTFYFIGDLGHASEETPSEALLALEDFLKSEGEARKENAFLVFLGDNLSQPDRLPFKEGLLEDFPGEVVFLPGELEWQKQGVEGLEAASEFLAKELGREEVYNPVPGCGLAFIDISDEVHLIVLDSQWFIADWDDHPLVNDNCPEIKTREALFTEIESELKKNQEKTTIIAVHHPLLSNGVHGGNNGWSSYLYPSYKKVPIPVVGQVTNLLRTSGGTSIQDSGNPAYSGFIARLRTIGKKWGKVVYASGHDHSLQYLEDGLSKQIVVGSGAITSYTEEGKHGQFAAEEPGFAVLNVYKDGSSDVRFIGKEQELLFQSEVYPEDPTYDIESLHDSFPETFTTTIYDSEQTQKSDFYVNLWGERYRELYSTEITAPVADLDTLYGGLEVIRLGGGNQTNSIRLKDSLDREYNIRMLRKDAVQFLQNTAYKNKPVEEAFEETFAEEMIEDFYTASHPYGYLVVPPLSEVAGIHHPNPEVFYLPKQPGLGEYNSVHGDELYMIEERPEEHWLGYEDFGSPNHDIESTSGLFERLRRDEKYSLDEASFIRARVFDMLIGDWDRHNDQWRWAEIELENGDRVFEAIPRDRDQAFSNFDGWIFRNFRQIIGFLNQFGHYSDNIDNVEWFNRSASNLDRNLIENSGREEWIAQAEFLQETLTDEVIEEAFTALPEALQGESTQGLIQKMKGRRENLVDIVSRYYDELAETAIMTGTDKDDIIDIIRMEDGRTEVKISRNKDGERGELVNQRIYEPEETEEVWVYGLDDDDEFYVEGADNSEIIVKIIGGQNNDVFNILQGDGIRVYDHRTKPNTVEQNNGAKIFFTDNYEINTFDRDFKIIEKNSVLPYLSFNPDDGVIFGARAAFTDTELVRKPFTSRHSFGASYFFGTGGFEVEYAGEFAHAERTHNLLLGAHYSSASSTSNFFGFGNETQYDRDEVSKDYNRIRISSYGAELGLVRRSKYGSTFRYSALFEGVKVEDTPDRFISLFPETTDFFDRMFFAGLEAMYSYESYDNSLNPAKGLHFNLTAGGKMNVEETDNTFLYVKPYLELFTPISANERWVLNPRLQGQVNFLDGYEFFQAATLGGKSGLRSFRHERFAGERSFAAGTDLRYTFPEVQGNFLPYQLGIFGGYDIGRVWLDGEDSNTWHQSYGGGFWISVAKAAAAQFNLFHGEEGLRFSFGFEFGF